MENTIRKKAISLSREAAFILLTVASAVILPQILHGVGALLGIGGQLGQMLLPMYIPVLILGFYRGPVPAAIVGLMAPLVSFALTGMPAAVILPYITVELIATGVLAGVFSKVKIAAPLRVLATQAAAKAVRVAVHATVLAITTGGVKASVLFAGVLTSIPGLLVQLILVSYLIIEKEKKNNA